MRSVRRSLSALVLLLALGSSVAHAQGDTQAADDEKLLKAASVAVDGPGLVDFFRKRTPTGDMAKRIDALMKNLGDRRFKVREQAAADLVALGPPALGALQNAVRTADLETQRRASQCIKKIEQRNAPEAVSAAARLLKARRPAGACAVLLTYLPNASDEAAEAIVQAVFSLGGSERKVDPAVAAALTDAAPARRAAAALVLGRYGTTEQRRAVHKLLDDTNLPIRFRAAQGLLCRGDRSVVPVLVGLLEKAPLPLAESAEDLLTRIAGAQEPKVSLGENAKERVKCRAAWEAWWGAHKDKLDLAKVDLRSPFADARTLARTAARRFVAAMDKHDWETARKMIDVPFVIDPFQVMKTRAEVDKLFQAGQGPNKATYRMGKIVRLDEYRRQPRDGLLKNVGVKETLNELPRHAEIRAALLEITQAGQTIKAAILVRVHGSRAWVVGLGILGLGKGS